MISRAAECCFWLHRHIERMDNTARLLDTTRVFLLDADLEGPRRWRPVLAAAGEEDRFAELFGPAAMDDGEQVETYMTWETRCPASIRSSAHWARENAIAIRETLSLEAWNALNSFCLWLNDGAGKRIYRAERNDFYARIKEAAQLIRGILDDTLLHDEPYDFMRLGMLLERVCQTARILDVKYERLGPTTPEQPERADDLAQWLAILRSCAGTESFLKRGRSVSGPAVAGFLMLDPSFPRSILHNIVRSCNFMSRIGSAGGVGKASVAMLDSLRERVQELDENSILTNGLHETLTSIIRETESVCIKIHEEFFDPQLNGDGWSGVEGAA